MRKINLFFVLLVAWMLGTGVAIAQEKGKNPLLAVAEYNLSLIHISEPTRPY